MEFLKTVYFAVLSFQDLCNLYRQFSISVCKISDIMVQLLNCVFHTLGMIMFSLVCNNTANAGEKSCNHKLYAVCHLDILICRAKMTSFVI